MARLIDTNVLVRFFDGGSKDQGACVKALEAASKLRGDFCICLQVQIEFWSVATRGRYVNGLDFTPAKADAALQQFERILTLAPEPMDVASRWRNLVVRYGVSGKEVHDARIVALMDGMGIAEIVTLNGQDFARYPHIRVVAPSQVS